MSTAHLTLDSPLLMGTTHLARAKNLYASIKALQEKAEQKPLCYDEWDRLKKLRDLVGLYFQEYGVPLKELCQMSGDEMSLVRARRNAQRSIDNALRDRAGALNPML